jgi:hypothetical protein
MTVATAKRPQIVVLLPSHSPKPVFYNQSSDSWFAIIDTRTNKIVAVDLHTQLPGGEYFA